MKDQLNRQLTIENKPRRIVSLVPSQTELLVDLGLRDQIVGITKFCVHPSDLRSEKVVVGGTKQVHFDEIRELDPDIILCNKEENTPEMVAELEKICPVHISDINTIDDCLELIEMYGNLFGIELKSKDLIEIIQSKKQEFEIYTENFKELNVAYFIWKNPWMVVGSETFIDYILNLNRFKNVFADHSRYPEVELSELNEKQLDVIFLSSEPFPFKEKHVNAMKTMFPNTKIQIVDGEMFSWYGSRLMKSFDYFKSLHQVLKR